MKLFVSPRPDHGDYVLMLYKPATEFYPEHADRSKMAFLPDDSPVFQARTDTPGFHYRGDDAKAIYDAAQISMGEEYLGSLHSEYEAIREQYPQRGLKPFSELTPEEYGRVYRVSRETQIAYNEIAESIRKEPR